MMSEDVVPDKYSPARRLLILYLIGMTAMHVAALRELTPKMLAGYGDFSSFYTAGKLVKEGAAGSLYDSAVQLRIQQQFAPDVTIRHGPMPFVRPPFQALFFVPFAYLTYPVACSIWLVFNFLLLLAFPFILPEHFRARTFTSQCLSGCLCLGIFPVAIALINGQDSIIVLFILTLALSSMLRGKDVVGGILLGLCLFKFHLIIPLALVFLVRGRYRLFVAFTAVALLFLLVSIALVGWHGVYLYPQYVMNLDRIAGAGVAAPQYMPNLRAVLQAISGRPLAGYLRWGFSLLSAASLLAVALIRHGDRGQASTAGAFGLALVVILLTAYYSYCYDLTILLLPIFLSWKRMMAPALAPLWKNLFLISMGLFLLSPLHWVLLLKTHSYYAFGVAILSLLCVSIWWALADSSYGHTEESV